MNYNSPGRPEVAPRLSNTLPKAAPVPKNAARKRGAGLLVVAAFLLLLATPKCADAQVIYVSNEGAGTIGEYNASTGAVINPALVTGLQAPEGIALDSSGNLYVASEGTGTHRGNLGAEYGDYNQPGGAGEWIFL